jgi:hypothetical protein
MGGGGEGGGADLLRNMGGGGFTKNYESTLVLERIWLCIFEGGLKEISCCKDLKCVQSF